MARQQEVSIMNCVKGDIAFVIANCRWNGWLVTVLEFVPPYGEIRSPDGVEHINDGGRPAWLIEAPRPFNHGGKPWCRFAVGSDRGLKPIRPSKDGENESFFEAAPQPQSRAAELLS